jgi:biotin transporter BioY
METSILTYIYCLIIGMLTILIVGWLYVEYKKKVKEEENAFWDVQFQLNYDILDFKKTAVNKIKLRNRIDNIRKMKRADQIKVNDMEKKFIKKFSNIN